MRGRPAEPDAADAAPLPQHRGEIGLVALRRRVRSHREPPAWSALPPGLGDAAEQEAGPGPERVGHRAERREGLGVTAAYRGRIGDAAVDNLGVAGEFRAYL